MDFSSRKTAGALLFVGSAQFVVALIIAEAIFPGYSVSKNYISDLGTWNQPSAFIFNPSAILLGLVCIAGSYFIQRAFRMRGITVLFALLGVGTLGVGIFPENILTVNGVPVPHTIAAMIAFVVGGIASIASYKITKSPFRYLGVILGGTSLLAFVLFLTTASSNYLGLGVGGMERMITYPTLIWTVGLGGNLMSSPINEKK